MTEEEFDEAVLRMGDITLPALLVLQKQLRPLVGAHNPKALYSFDAVMDLAILGLGVLDEAKRYGSIKLWLRLYKDTRKGAESSSN